MDMCNEFPPSYLTNQVLPFYLQFHINADCNLRCKHCYEDFDSKNLHCGQLSSTEVLALLDSYANFLKIVHGDGIVYFTGGEPLMDHPLMQQLRTRVQFEGKCHNCEKLKNCGGCRAVAYAVHNSVLAEDPQCFYCENTEIGMKEKIKEKIKRLIFNGLMLKSGQNSRAPIVHKDLRDTHQSHGNLVDNMLQSRGD